MCLVQLSNSDSAVHLKAVTSNVLVWILLVCCGGQFHRCCKELFVKRLLFGVFHLCFIWLNVSKEERADNRHYKTHAVLIYVNYTRISSRCSSWKVDFARRKLSWVVIWLLSFDLGWMYFFLYSATELLNDIMKRNTLLHICASF